MLATLLPAVPLAFLAGLASVLSPCVFPLIPAYAAFLGGEAGRDTTPPPGAPMRLVPAAHGPPPRRAGPGGALRRCLRLEEAPPAGPRHRFRARVLGGLHHRLLRAGGARRHRAQRTPHGGRRGRRRRGDRLRTADHGTAADPRADARGPLPPLPEPGDGGGSAARAELRRGLDALSGAHPGGDPGRRRGRRLLGTAPHASLLPGAGRALPGGCGALRSPPGTDPRRQSPAAAGEPDGRGAPARLRPASGHRTDNRVGLAVTGRSLQPLTGPPPAAARR